MPVQALRVDALHAELTCPCGARCLVGLDLERSQDGMNAFLLMHGAHASAAAAHA